MKNLTTTAIFMATVAMFFLSGAASAQTYQAGACSFIYINSEVVVIHDQLGQDLWADTSVSVTNVEKASFDQGSRPLPKPVVDNAQLVELCVTIDGSQWPPLFDVINIIAANASENLNLSGGEPYTINVNSVRTATLDGATGPLQARGNPSVMIFPPLGGVESLMLKVDDDIRHLTIF